jgi:hypothetical protein
MIKIQTYYGEGFDPSTSEVIFWGRIVHISIGSWFKNFHLWGARKGSPAWGELWGTRNGSPAWREFYDEEVGEWVGTQHDGYARRNA